MNYLLREQFNEVINGIRYRINAVLIESLHAAIRRIQAKARGLFDEEARRSYNSIFSQAEYDIKVYEYVSSDSSEYAVIALSKYCRRS